MTYAAAAFIIASSLQTRFLYQYTKNETWIPVIIGFVLSFIIISIYGRLARNHPGLSLIHINDAVFGSVLGKIVSAFYVFNFLMLLILNTEDLGDFVKGFILQSTPITIIYVVFLFVCSFASRKGAVAMTRYAVLLTVLYIAAVVINSFFLINRMHLENLLPAFILPVKNYLMSAHIVTMLSYCEVLAFLMFAPYMQKPDEMGKAMKRGLMIGFVVLLVIILRDIIVLGNYTLTTSSPTYNSIRLIDVGDILTRLEIIFAVALMTMLFFKVSILFFSTVSSFGQIFNIEQYKIFIYIFLALVVVYANGMFTSSSEHVKWTNSAPAYSTFFLFLLPLITLIVSEIRKNAKKNANDEPLKLD